MQALADVATSATAAVAAATCTCLQASAEINNMHAPLVCFHQPCKHLQVWLPMQLLMLMLLLLAHMPAGVC
jgi:hypothetical protein